jgi:hypothetical protein
MRWARVSLCTVVASTMLLLASLPVSAGVRRENDTAGATSSGPALTLISQTPWVGPTAPWFSLSVKAGSRSGPVADLHVELTFYNRISDDSELSQDTGSLPENGQINHFTWTLTTSAGRASASTCTTVLPEESASPPATAPTDTVACPANSPTLTLGCTPGNGTCDGIYPVSVALYRPGTDAPLGRFTTFLTYQEPNASSAAATVGGPLRVGLVMSLAAPLSPTSTTPSRGALEDVQRTTGVLAAHRGVAVTLAANPVTVASLQAGTTKEERRTVTQLAALSTAPTGDDELLDQPYVPIDVATLTRVGLSGEISAQLSRGTALLHAALLHPTAGTWVDTSSTLSSADAGALGTGLQAANADHLVLNDADLAPGGSDKLTFAQTFSLPVGHSGRVTAAATNSDVEGLFTAEPNDPVLAANQIVATLEFLHFELPNSPDHRGIVVEPPASAQTSTTLLTTLLTELAGNPVLSPVTLDQFFAQVRPGGNSEPSARHLVAAPATPSSTAAKGSTLTAGAARHLTTARIHLESFTHAVSGHPAVLVTLSDLLLATENRSFDSAQRAQALSVFIQRFGDEVNLVSLAAQSTITFTSRTAAIPVSVVSSATFTVKVVLSLSSDKFAFPNGNTRTLLLDHPTTPVRIQARSVTSGDRLPVEVTLTTPDGQLVIARAALTVHSTSISIVGIALTALAALVLLVWWGRTWRKGRRRRPRAA